MPVCFRNVLLVNKGKNSLGDGAVVIGNAVGQPLSSPPVQPMVASLMDSAGGVDSCDAVGLTGAEYQKVMTSAGVQQSAWQELGNMSIENAQVISACVAGVWAVAWAFRVISKSISTFESQNHE